MNKGIIYLYTSPSGRKYVGQTINEKKRRSRFLNINDSYGGVKIDRARQKYKPENFTYEVLETYYNEDKEVLKDILNKRETYNIKLYDTLVNGYNCDEGGNSRIGYVPTDEARLNMSIGQKNRSKESYLEGAKKISLAKKGITPTTAIESHRIAVNAYTKTGELVGTYISIKEAADQLGVHHENISKVLKGERKTTGGYVFKYN